MSEKQSPKHSKKKLKAKKDVEPEKKFDVVEPEWTSKEKWLLGRCKDFELKIELLSKDIEKQNTVIRKNNSLLEKLLKHVCLPTNGHGDSQLFQKTDSKCKDLVIFPIKSLIELESIDNKIKDIPEGDIIANIKHYIGDSSIRKSVHTFFDESLILQINWNGTRGMTAVKNLKLFTTFVYDAVKTPAYPYSQYISEMKEGFRIAKSDYKKKHKANQSISKASERLNETTIATTDAVDPKLVRKMSDIFPIKSIKALEDIDKSIQDNGISEADIASYIKNVLKVRDQNNIKDIVPQLFDESIVLEISWNGKRNKVPIKDLRLFNTYIFDAVRAPDLSYGNYTLQMKMGFQLAKKRVYRKKQMLSKKAKLDESEKAEQQVPKTFGILQAESDHETYTDIEIKQDISKNFESFNNQSSYEHLGNQENDTPSYSAFSEYGDSELYPKFDVSNIFPIKSYRALERIDRRIQSIPEDDLIDYIREAVGSASVKDSIQMFFGEPLVTQINWNGTNKLKPLKHIKLFNTYVFEAIKTPMYQYDQYISEINKGLLSAKSKLPKKSESDMKVEKEESYEEEDTPMCNSTTYQEDGLRSGILSIFPIRTLEQLSQADDDVLGIPDEDIIKHIKGIIGNMELKHCLQYLFDDSIILEINWNGTFNKIAAKNFKLFNTYLFEAVRTLKFGYKEYAEEMKKGFRYAKALVYKNRSKNRNNL